MISLTPRELLLVILLSGVVFLVAGFFIGRVTK